jgi:hypothetical protein
MSTDRRRAVVAGVLLIVATATSLLSGVFLSPIHDSRYLVDIAAHDTQVEVGVLLTSIAALTAPGIAAALYPVIRRFGEGRAVGALAFRVIEGTAYLLSAMLVLSLVTLSRDYLAAGKPAQEHYRVLGDTLLSTYRVLGNVALLFAFAIGALLYYSVFYEARLVPRWLAGWGIIGAVTLLAAAVLITLRTIAAESAVQFVLAAPIGLQEMVLAGWLIANGFAAQEPTSSQPIDAGAVRGTPARVAP